MRLSSARLALLYTALVTLLTGLLLASVYLLTRSALEREISAVVRAEVEDLADELRLGGLDRLVATLELRTDSWGRTGAVFLLADREFHPVAGNLSEWPRDVPATPAAMVEFEIIARERDRRVLHPVEARIERLSNGYWLLVGADTSERQNVLRRFGLATLWGIALTALCVWLLGAAYARRTARRVRGYADTCESIMQGDLTQRLRVDGPGDEFDALAAAVNAMLDRIEQQTTTLRAAFDSIAHDLRTPLYRLRVRLEEAQLRDGADGNAHPSREAQEIIGPALEELDRVQRTLATLLAIARAEAQGVTTHADNVDLASLTANLVELYAPGMRAAGLEVSCDATTPAPLTGNRQLLAQLITNLLENALKYVPAGGRVRVSVTSTPNLVELSVADNGPGIAAEDRAAALQPFVRVGDSARTSGSGLGLSLAAAVARLHRARLTLGDNAPGLIVRVEFPTDARRDLPGGVAQVS
jgi:signal transduction histidine kinase